ncbi:DUF3858 domain-containing protein [Marinoscillum sp.]|uniref:DUF3858 domain-containing protein n=1 Tax=Marinoscillum sp. TaxID=2024838 RepID=UPI003BA8F770
MRYCILIFFLLSATTGWAQTILEQVPDSIKRNSNEIVLIDETEFEILDIGKTRELHHYQAVIVNSKASDRNIVTLGYDEFTSISNAEVIISTVGGEEIERYKLKDFRDFSEKGSNLASDNRSKYLKPLAQTPYLIEVTYELEHNGSLFYPTWVPQSDEHQAVVSARLKIISKNIPFRYKAIGMSEPSITNDGTFTWEINGLKPFEYENYSPQYYHYTPMLYTAPNDFVMDNLQGNMSSWENLGKWQYELMKDQNTLSESVIEEVKAMIPEEASELDKMRIVYEYVQNNTRYVSIQLGIGGWKPFDSQFVHEKKYGDCKALSFYTKSLLEAVGIQAYYTLINAGPSKREPFSDFPARVFNHVIVTVPTAKDTVWLECTSQTNPFGYLGTFTSDRNALMVTENGGTLIRTKRYGAKENEQQTITTIDIKEDGQATVALSRKYAGLEIGNNRFSAAIHASEDEQTKWFYDNHSWGSVTVASLNLTKPTSEIIPKGQMDVELVIDNFASVSSNRMFLSPFRFTNLTWMDVKNNERTRDLVIKYPFTQTDTVFIKLPAKLAPENLPKDTQTSTKFGTFDLKVNASEDGIELIRQFQLNQGSYSTAEYADFREFIRAVQKSDRQKIVMLDKT